MMTLIPLCIFSVSLVYSHPFYYDNLDTDHLGTSNLDASNLNQEVHRFESSHSQNEYDNKSEFYTNSHQNDKASSWFFPELDPPTYSYGDISETYQRWESLNFTPPAFINWGVTKERYGYENKELVPDPTDFNTTVLKVIYPKGSRNPAHYPRGGIGFDAVPISLQDGVGQTVRLSYQVYFPEDFDFKHGKQ
ncbi:hypothetical protein K7432_005997 [Basidiobolus ranarum]|uniref:Polysaccharide lyase 14 domain-containing protein n=1 Tax=Basidiobolus ranarum TaxID=34480 RepID=A0ABR2WVQ0_9FUNG